MWMPRHQNNNIFEAGAYFKVQPNMCYMGCYMGCLTPNKYIVIFLLLGTQRILKNVLSL